MTTKWTARYIAKLECGHKISLRGEPKIEGMEYGCLLGLGCGYRLKVVSYVTPDGIERLPRPGGGWNRGAKR